MVCSAADEIQYSGLHYVEVGSTFNITCRVPITLEPIKWTRNSTHLDGPEYNKSLLFNISIYYKVAVLVVRNARPEHSGFYKCHEFEDPYHSVMVVHGKHTWPNPNVSVWSVASLFDEFLLVVKSNYKAMNSSN